MRMLLVLLVAVFAVVFAVQNVVVVPVSVLFWRLESSLAIIIVVCIALGALAGVLISMPSFLRMRSRERRLRAQLADLGQDELIERSADKSTVTPQSLRRASRQTGARIPARGDC